MCRLFTLLCCLMTLCPAAIARQSAPDAAALYREGTGLLKQGRRFERAIALLKSAADAEPGNLSYHIALGCAYASRAASIARAASLLPLYARDLQKYRVPLTAWNKAQSDPNNPEYQTPAPPPVVLHTKDDGLKFTLIKAEAEVKITLLAQSARAEYETATGLAKTDTEIAQAKYFQGWGEMVLLYYRYDDILKLKNPPTLKQIIAMFTEATTKMPDDPLYWQSLGDAQSFLFSRAPNFAEAIKAYQKATTLKRFDKGIWYRLYQLHRHPNSLLGGEYLRRAVDAEPDNAFHWYQWAFHLMKQEKPKGEKAAYISKLKGNSAAVDAVEQGNNAPRLIDPGVHMAVPALLTAAWGYQDEIWGADFDEQDFELPMSVALFEYAIPAAKEGNEREGVRTGRAVIAMGNRRIAGDNQQINTVAVHNRSIMAPSVVTVGYSILGVIYQTSTDTIAAAQFKEEYEAYKKEREVRRAGRPSLPKLGYDLDDY